MNTIVRVSYEGITYDLNVLEDLPLRLDMSTVEAGEIGNFYGIGSQRFSIPGNKENNRFFRHAYNISSDDIPGFYNSIPGRIIYSGETVLSGQFQLLEVISDEEGWVTYECSISDTVVQLKDSLANKLLRDADWSQFTHIFNKESVYASWNGELLNGRVFYPLACYGFDDPDNIQLPKFSFLPPGETAGNYLNNPLTPLLPDQLVPALLVKDVINAIVNQAGYIATGSWLDSDQVEDLYILPKGQEQLGIVGQPGTEAEFYAFVSGQPLQTIGTSATGTNVLYKGQASDPQGAYNAVNGLFTPQSIGEHEFSAAISFYNPVYAADADVEIKFRLVIGSQQAFSVLAEESMSLTSADGFNAYTLELSGKKFISNLTDKVWTQVVYTKTDGDATPPGVTIFQGNYQCTKAPASTLNTEVDMSLQWPKETKSYSVLKGLIEQFNLVVTPDLKNENIVTIETYRDWQSQAEVKDWTDKYDASQRKSINHTVDELPRELILKTKQDVDRFSKETVENDPGDSYGTLRLLAANNLSQGQRTIGDYFAPTILGSIFKYNSVDQAGNETWNLNLGSTTVFPHIYKLEDNHIKSYQFTPRIGYRVKGSLSGNQKIYLGYPNSYISISGSYSTLSNTNQLPVNDPANSYDLLFNNTYGTFTPDKSLNLTGGRTVYQTNWEEYIESLYWEGSKKVTLDLEFGPDEYKQIKLNDQIYIKDQVYRINKITGFNITARDTCTVELIRLYPAFFKQNSTPVPFPPIAPVPIFDPPVPIPVPGAPVPIPVPITPIPVAPVAPVPITYNTQFYLTAPQNFAVACGKNTLTTTPVWADVLAPDDITTDTLIYADEAMTTLYDGRGYWFGLGSFPDALPQIEVVIINGSVSSITECPTFVPVPTSPGEFFISDPTGTTESSCKSTTSGSVFVEYAPSVEYVQAGDYLKLDASFSGSFVGGNNWYGLSNPDRNIAQMAIQVNDYGRVITREDCVPLPPAPPPPTPIPTPIVVGTFYATDAQGGTSGLCVEPVGENILFANTTNINDLKTGNYGLYSDNQLIEPFPDNPGDSGYWFGIGDTSGSYSQFYGVVTSRNVMGNTFGGLTSITDCGTTVPVPVSPGKFRYGNPQGTSGAGGGEVGGACGQPTSASFWIYDTLRQGASSGSAYVTAGNYVYADENFTQPWVGNNSWWPASDLDLGFAQLPIQINDYGRIITLGDGPCVPFPPVPVPVPVTPTPVPSVEYNLTSAFLGAADSCIDTTDAYTVYSNVDSASLFSVADTLYADENLTTPWVSAGTSLWFGIGPSGSTGLPSSSVFLNYGEIANIYQCNPPVAPVPVAAYEFWYQGGFGSSGAGQTSTGACDNNTTGSNKFYIPSASTIGEIGIPGYDSTHVFTDPAGTIPFTQSINSWWAVSEPNSLQSKVALQLTEGGRIITKEYCVPVPIAPPIPTPAPVPVTNTIYLTDSYFDNDDVCDGITSGSIKYSANTVDEISIYSNIYNEDTLSTKFNGGSNFFGLSATGSASNPDKYVRIGVTGLVENEGSCIPIPTPAPPTPIPVPILPTSTEVYLIQGAQGNICNNLTTGTTPYYIPGVITNIEDLLTVYTDQELTSTFNGQDLYYGISIGSGSVSPEKQVQILVNGSTLNAATCPPPPVPVPISVFGLNHTTGYPSFPGTRCEAFATAGKFYTTKTRGLNLEVGDYLYTDASLTTLVNGANVYYGVATANDTTPEVEIRVNYGGQITYKANC